MGFFKTKEEKEEAKAQAEIKKQKSAIYMGETLQPIGKIPLGVVVGLSLKPDNKVLNIHYDKIDITLPFDRIMGFRTESEVSLKKASNSLGGALIGGALAGGVGAVIGAGKDKGKTSIKWVSTLAYKDKEGNLNELNFIDFGLTGYYSGENKNLSTIQFANTITKIVINQGEDITEL